MRCSKCGSENPSGRKFCGECGDPFAVKCPKCGAENTAPFKFCGECGATLGVATAASTIRAEPESSAIRVNPEAAPEALEGERKTVTALFADIRGSMELIEDLDPEEARRLVDPALKLMMDAVHRYEGYVAQSTGDGIFALFGAPVAHEDHPQRALHAARRMQEDLKRYADKLRERGQPPLSVRVGVNSGEVVVRSIQTGDAHTEYTPIGHSISLASRLQTLAAPGSVVIGESVRKFVEGYFQLKALGASKIKGVSEPVNVYEVTGLGPLRTRFQRSAGRGLTKFVGREPEMDALKLAAEQAKQERGQLVAAMADPGIGKSRLFYEFRAASQTGWMVLEAFSVSHGKSSAYLPLIDLLHGYFKVLPEDDKRTRREKINGRIITLDRALENALPYLFALLGLIEGDDPLVGMDRQARRRHTLDAIKRVILRESLNQPLMIVFEDLHWIDEETQAFLNLLVESIGNAKILLLVNYRPEYTHQWNSKTYYTQLRLDPLGRENIEEMLSAMLGDDKDLNPLKRLIVERSEGTPFFMEEIVQALFEDGVLQRNGSVKLARSMNAVKVPATVQAVLASRIDRLQPDRKELLQTLAVIGREFALSLLRRVVGEGKDEELERMLGDLQMAEFIYEQPATGDIEYSFKHALTQEVAANSILNDKRKILHEQTARAIESIFAGRLEDHVDQLAHHYSQSANTWQAVRYLQLAGEKAVQRAAYIQAIEYLTKGLGMLRTLPSDLERDRRELALQIAIGPPLIAVRGYAASDVQAAYVRSQELCDQLGERSQAFPIQVGLLGFYNVRGQHQKAHEIAERLLEIVDKSQDPSLLLVAWALAGVSSFWISQLAVARTHLEQAANLYDPKRDRSLAVTYGTDMGVVVFSYLGWTLWYLGYPDQAVKAAKSTLTLAAALPHSNSLGMGFSHTALLYLHLRDEVQTQRLAEAVINLSSEGEFAQWMAEGTILRAWALVQQGREAEGIGELRSGLAAWQRTGGGLMLPQYLGWLAEALGRTGRVDESVALVEDAFEIVSKSGECVHEAELCRLKGELMLRQNDPDVGEAAGCFRHAIAVSQQQIARSLELRATMSLARLLDKQGRRGEARAMLTEIYGWFTEGFDTADLKDAKALLDQLNQ